MKDYEMQMKIIRQYIIVGLEQGLLLTLKSIS